MKRAWLSLVSLLILSGCNRLDTLLYAPQQTGADWLNSQPFVALEIASRKLILTQPSSTVFVYLLGVLTISIGIYFLKIREEHLSRKWWGIALLFWGTGAILVGPSFD